MRVTAEVDLDAYADLLSVYEAARELLMVRNLFDRPSGLVERLADTLAERIKAYESHK